MDLSMEREKWFIKIKVFMKDSLNRIKKMDLVKN
jgi:hypothetical protein